MSASSAPPPPGGAPAALDPTQAARRDALTGRLFQATLGTMDLLTVYLGDRLGLYRALADRGPRRPRPSWRPAPARTSATPGSGWSSRPSAGSWTWRTRSLGPGERRYTLPAGHAEVLTERGQPQLPGLRWPLRRRPGRAAPSCWTRSAAAAGVSWARLRAPTCARARPSRTAPSSSTSWVASGCRPSPTSTPASPGPPRRTRPRLAWPTSPAARAGRASPSPGVPRGPRGRLRPRRPFHRDGPRQRRRPGGRRSRPPSTSATPPTPPCRASTTWSLICECPARPAGPRRRPARDAPAVVPGGTVLVVDERVARGVRGPRGRPGAPDVRL